MNVDHNKELAPAAPGLEAIPASEGKPRWLRHAVGWMLVSLVCLQYLNAAAAGAVLLIGIVTTAYWANRRFLALAQVVKLGSKHGAWLSLGIIVLSLVGPSIGVITRQTNAAAFVIMYILSAGVYFSLVAVLYVIIFYLFVWAAQQLLQFRQPIKSFPIIFAVLAAVAVLANAREAVFHSPEKVRAANQEICRRGEAPSPDQERPMLSTCAIHSSEITAVRFTADGKFLVSLGGDGYKVWDLEARTLRSSLSAQRMRVSPRHILLSPDDRLLVTSTGQDSPGLAVWLLLKGEPVGEYHTAPGDKVEPLGFGMDSRSVLGFSRQQGLLVWDLELQRVILAQPLGDIDWCTGYPSPNFRFTAVVCTKNNAAQMKPQFYVWDSQEEIFLNPSLRVPGVYGIEFSDDARMMAVGTGGKPTDFDFYDTASWAVALPPSEMQKLLQMRIELARGYGEIFWLPDPRPDRRGYRINAYKITVSRDGNIRVVYPEGPYNLRLVETRTGQSVDLCPPGCYGVSPILHALALSPDQRWLAVVYGGSISLWDLTAKQFVTSLHGITPRNEGRLTSTEHAGKTSPETLATQCKADVADACYRQGLNEQQTRHPMEADTLLRKACSLRTHYCLELADAAKTIGNSAGEVRWLEIACNQGDIKGCQQWFSVAERSGDRLAVQKALLGQCVIQPKSCPSLLPEADRVGTNRQVVDLVCSQTAEGCEYIGRALESLQRSALANRAFRQACQMGREFSCRRE